MNPKTQFLNLHQKRALRQAQERERLLWSICFRFLVLLSLALLLVAFLKGK